MRSRPFPLCLRVLRHGLSGAGALVLVFGLIPTGVMAASSSGGVLDRPAGAVREVTSKRTAQATTWELASGAHVTRIAPEPVRWKGADGAWRRFDTRLHSTADGRKLVSADGPADLILPRRLGGADSLTHVGSKDGWIEASLVGADSAGEVDGASVLFPDALSGVDVHLVSTGLAVKETLKLGTARAQRTFTYRLRLSFGLSARHDSGSGSIVIARGEKAVFEVPRATLTDSARPAVPGPSPSYGLKQETAASGR